MNLQQRQEAMRRHLEAQRVRQQEEPRAESPVSSVCGHSAGMTKPETQARSSLTKGATDVRSDAPRTRLLDLKSAGAYLGVSYWTMRDLVFGGIIPSVKIPCTRAGDGRAIRRILVDRCDLDTFIENNKELEQ
jgi:hypothetical protein